MKYNIIIGLTLSFLSVIFGALAYWMTYNIFNKGLQIEEDKLWSQISLEFSVGFVHPLFNFISRIPDTVSIPPSFSKSDIPWLYSAWFLPVNLDFIVWEGHKGEIWSTLERANRSCDEFERILNFIESARKLCRELPNIRIDLEKELSSNEKITEKAKGELKRGIDLINTTNESISLLPPQLKIRQTMRKLFKDEADTFDLRISYKSVQ